MKKKIAKTFLIILFLMICCGQYKSFGSAVPPMIFVNTDNDYGLYDSVDNRILNVANLIGGFLRWAALAIAVGMLMIKGIKFITAAPEGKAEIKKEMIPWTIGVIILFTFNIVLNVIIGMADTFNKVPK